MSDSLLYHRGVPVPWIARWSAEVVSPRPAFGFWITADGMRVTFLDERPEDRIDGVLWLRENDAPGQGTPDWATVQSHRQRACQVEGRCQVCGRVIDERPVTWLIPKIPMRKTTTGTIITDVAPTCTDCLQLARVSCPYLLAKDHVAFNVYDWRPSAVFGDVIDLGRRIPLPPYDAPYMAPPSTMIRHYQATAPLTGYVGNVMARQMVVELWNYQRRRVS
jgi:hypothetical protein